MSDIYFYSEEINNLLEDFKRILDELEKEEEKNEKTEKYCNDIHFINERIKTAKDAYFIEIRNLSEEEQIENISKIKNKMIILENLNIQFDFKKSKLIYEEEKQAKENKKMLKVRYISAKDIETKGDIIQDQTDDAIFRMKMMVDESENITKDAANKLNTQNEKLQKARDKIEDVDINVYSAKQTLKEIAKEAVTDRFVRLMTILIFIVVTVLITVIIISRKQTPVVINEVMTENESIRKNKTVRRQEINPNLTKDF
ncbi:SNARE protein, putative [Plasmodium sp. DRC-Itaito]|nr:SNARE protein, putative [Plasmodium sp. DRC-Itaito]